MEEKYLDLEVPTFMGIQWCLSVFQAISWLEQRQLPVEKITTGFLQNQLVRKVRLSLKFPFVSCVKVLAKIEHRGFLLISWVKAGEKVWNDVEKYLIQRMRSMHSEESCSILLE